MFGFGKGREPELHCSECGGRMSRHVGERCPSSVWDAVKEVAADMTRPVADKYATAAAKQKAARADADLKYMAEVAERAAIAKEANRQVRSPGARPSQYCVECMTYHFPDEVCPGGVQMRDAVNFEAPEHFCELCGIWHRKELPCPPAEVLAQLKEKAAKSAEVPHWYTAPEHPQAKAPELPPRKLYGGELLNDLHKRVVALEDKATVKDAGFRAGRSVGRCTAFDEVEAIIQKHLHVRETADPVWVVLSNVLHQVERARKP